MTNNNEIDLIDNAAWLGGWAAYEEARGCPWDASARLGWIAARDHYSTDETTAAELRRKQAAYFARY